MGESPDPPPTSPAQPDRKKSVNLHFRVPVAQYDAMYAQARAERLNIPEWVRRVLKAATPTGRGQ